MEEGAEVGEVGAEALGITVGDETLQMSEVALHLFETRRGVGIEEDALQQVIIFAE